MGESDDFQIQDVSSGKGISRSEYPDLVDQSEGTPMLEVKTPDPKGTIFSTVFNVANAALGAGILAYPYGFAEAGYVGAIVIMLMISVLSAIGNYSLVRYCHEFCPGATSYQEVFRRALGKGAEWFTIICAIINSFGTCVAYLVVIGDNMVPVFNLLVGAASSPTPSPSPFNLPSFSPSPSPFPSPSPSSSVAFDALRQISPSPFPSPSPFTFPSPSPTPISDDPWYVGRAFVITSFAIVFIFPLCCFKKISLLGYTSFFSVLSILVVVITVVFYAFAGTTDIKGNPTNSFSDSEQLWQDVSLFHANFNFLQVFPIVAFSYQAHVTTPPLYSELANRSPMKMYISLGCAMIVVSVLYLLTGFFGYVTFGDNLTSFATGSDILSIYKSTPLLIASNVCVSMVAVFSFPILQFVARLSLIDVVVFVADKQGYTISKTNNFMYYGLTFFFFFLCLIVAIEVPNINVVIGLVGGGVVVCMMLILPGLLLRLMAIERNNKAEEIFSYVFTGTGVAIFILSVGISLYNDIKGTA